MKKFLKIGGIVLVILVFTLVAGYFILKPGIEYKKSSVFAKDVSTRIAATWSISELKDNSAPKLIEIMNNDPETVNKLFTIFQSRLGKLQSLSDMRGEVLAPLVTFPRQDITAAYQADAVFEKGKGEILIRLIKIDGAWKIFDFKVNSKALLQ